MKLVTALPISIVPYDMGATTLSRPEGLSRSAFSARSSASTSPRMRTQKSK